MLLDCVQIVLEYLQRKRVHNLSGQPVPVSGNTHSKEILLHVQVEFPVDQFLCVTSCPIAWLPLNKPRPPS